MRHEDSEDQLLFDLPLGPVAATPSRPEPKRAPARSTMKAAPAPPPALIVRDEDEDDQETDLPEASAAARAGLGSRLAAGSADLLVHAAVLMIALIGTRLLGVRATLADAPALGVFLLAFSFLYTIVPLAFWGHTLGMAWTGLISQNRDGEPLTFGQTARRWLGGVLTLAAAGLPLLLALGGRSLADLLSGSVTWAEQVGDEGEPEAA
jgi:uncharacterized RDD family membrane protein YckC